MLQAVRIVYNVTRAMIPIVASYAFEDDIFFKVLIIIWYAGSRVLNSAVWPSNVLTWPEQIVMADPVTNEAIDGRGMNSMMNPNRANPMNVMRLPHDTVIARAICGPGILGCMLCTSVMTVPITVETTATG